MANQQIVIMVEGGIILDIKGIPPGVDVVVRDYDVDSYDADVKRDEHGCLCAEYIIEVSRPDGA